MSLVDVRMSSLDVPTSGAGLGRGRGAVGSPLSSPLSSPLDSPLGSPLGAVSLDAAVFVAKGGALAGAMLEDSQLDQRTDSFADAYGTPSNTTAEAPSLGPSCSVPSIPSAEESTEGAPTSPNTQEDKDPSVEARKASSSPSGSSSCSPCGGSSVYSPSSTPPSSDTTSCNSPAPPPDTARETRSIASRGEVRMTRTRSETPSSTSYDTRSLRRTRRASSGAPPQSSATDSGNEEGQDSGSTALTEALQAKGGTGNESANLAKGKDTAAVASAAPPTVSAVHTPPSVVNVSSSTLLKTPPRLPSGIVSELKSQASPCLPRAVTLPSLVTNASGSSAAPLKRVRLTTSTVCSVSTEVTDSLGRKLYVLPSIPMNAKVLTSARTLPNLKASTEPTLTTISCPAENASPRESARSARETTTSDSTPTSSSSDDTLTRSTKASTTASPATETTPTLTRAVASAGEHSPASDSLSQTLLNPILSKALSPRNVTLAPKLPDLVSVSFASRQPAAPPTALENHKKLSTMSQTELPNSAVAKLETTPANTPLKNGASGAESEGRLKDSSTDSPGEESSSQLTNREDSLRPRARPVNNTSPSAVPAASAPSLSRLATLRRSTTGECEPKAGLSDSSSSSLSTATSPGALGLDCMAAPEVASTAPLFTESPDDLIDVADALNVLGATDDDGVGSSQDSTGVSSGSGSSISSCCSGGSSCCGTSNYSIGSGGSCCSGNRQRSRALSPSRLGPQQCQVCSKIFSNASALAKHKLTHSDERRYVCSVCCKAFKRQDHLNGHMLTHRNKKPYECMLEGCNKSYCDARSLRRHEENHHHMRGLPAVREKSKEREKEKEARRRNSKTILSLLSTSSDQNAKSSDCANANDDSEKVINQYQAPSSTISSFPSQFKVTTSTQLSNMIAPTMPTVAPIILPTVVTSSVAPTSLAVTKVSTISSMTTTAITPNVTAKPPTAQSSENQPSQNQGVLSTNAIPTLLSGKQPVVQLDITQAPAVSTHYDTQGTATEGCATTPNAGQTQATGVAIMDQKRAQQEIGLVRDMPAASTPSCAPVSTPISSKSASTSTSTLETISTKSSTASVTLSFNSCSNTSTTNTSCSGISSCKVSSTAHLGSMRDAQGSSVIQPSLLVPSLLPEDNRNTSKISNVVVNASQSKPVACNLCNRRFKNIPALNGHMRLHGGYFKKESESKRTDKRESTGPPLQTASVSVRQLIEEKIIQKRGGTIGRVALLAGRDNPVSSSTVTSSMTTSVTFNSASSAHLIPNRVMIDRRKSSEQQENVLKKAPAISDSVSAASVLQHHNYANSSFSTPPPSTNVSNANSPPPPPISPLNCSSFLPLSPQSDGSEPHQLLIHSEDPLLSSTIKDIARKRIDLGSLTVLGSVLVERGGELHLIQAPTAIVQRLSSRNTKPRVNSDSCGTASSHVVPTSATSVPSYQLTTNIFKGDDIEDVFLGPSMVPDTSLNVRGPAMVPGLPTNKQLTTSLSKAPSTSPSSTFCAPPVKRSRLSRPYPTHKSRLRSCRREAICSASTPYTPAPMLDPNRLGVGLMGQAGSSWYCSSTTTDGEDSGDAIAISAPETDSFPHVNVGSRFQCSIPSCDRQPYTWSEEPENQDYLLWEPAVTQKCTDAEVDAFLEFACCDAVPGGGRNQEYALHLLHMCDGDIQEAVVQLMQRNPLLPPEHSLLSYDYGVTDLWNGDEMDAFVKGLLKHSKNWTLVANEIGSKTAKECVQFYYLWKKLCPDEYNSLRTMWKAREKNDDMNNNLNVQADAHLRITTLPSAVKCSSLSGENLEDFQCLFRPEEESRLRQFDDSGQVSNREREVSGLRLNHQMDVSNSKKNGILPNPLLRPLVNTSPPKFIKFMDLSVQAELPSNTTQKLTEAKNNNVCQQDIKSFVSIDDQKVTKIVQQHTDFKHTAVKSEPWEYNIKEGNEPSPEKNAIENTKLFISEFNQLKLSNPNKSPENFNERVEEAPIIVKPAEHMHDDSNDDVKMEIESMMALHGIRMEDEGSNDGVIKSALGSLGTFKEEPDDPESKPTNLPISDTCSCSTSALTEEHVSTSSESRLFVCELADCSASFNSRAALNGHIRIHGYRKSPPPNATNGSLRLFSQRQEYPCKTCGKIFGKLKSRSAHMKTHKLSPEQQRADLAETLAGRATGVSSSGDIPTSVPVTSTSLSFSTCPTFALTIPETPIASAVPSSDLTIPAGLPPCENAVTPPPANVPGASTVQTAMENVEDCSVPIQLEESPKSPWVTDPRNSTHSPDRGSSPKLDGLSPPDSPKSEQPINNSSIPTSCESSLSGDSVCTSSTRALSGDNQTETSTPISEPLPSESLNIIQKSSNCSESNMTRCKGSTEKTVLRHSSKSGCGTALNQGSDSLKTLSRKVKGKKVSTLYSSAGKVK